jgi:hypothetical protein
MPASAWAIEVFVGVCLFCATAEGLVKSLYAVARILAALARRVAADGLRLGIRSDASPINRATNPCGGG